MHIPPCTKLALTLAGMLAGVGLSAKADTFGSGLNEFAIDFVHVGNPGNADDASSASIYSAYGGVGYEYRMGTYEVTEDAFSKAVASGLMNATAGVWAGSQPAAGVQWYEAAAFVNFLNTSTGHQAAYNLSFNGAWSMAAWGSGETWQLDGENSYRHKDAFYFLPSEDEWFKAAYHKGGEAAADYWNYATGGDTLPDGIDFAGDPVFEAVFDDGGRNPEPNDVTNVGVASAYGTFGQNGNVWEWHESSYYAPFDDSADGLRGFRGGSWAEGDYLHARVRAGDVPTTSGAYVGFRVASVVPEPSCSLLLLGSGWMWLLKRRR